jgi:hypothetical protein
MIAGKNWPAFYPVVVHDIDAELSAAGQPLAKRSYFIWQCTGWAEFNC